MPRTEPRRHPRASLRTLAVAVCIHGLVGCAASPGSGADAGADALPAADVARPAAPDARGDARPGDAASQDVGDAAIADVAPPWDTPAADVAPADALDDDGAEAVDGSNHDTAPPDAAGDTTGDVEADVASDVAADVPPPPDDVLGLPLRDDGVLYAGAAAVDITPDLDSGRPVYLAGFGQNRLAEGVRDPLWVRAVVLSRDREYVAIVAADLVGLTSYRISLAAERLAVDGFAPERLIVQASHNHASPDTVGLWGPTRSETGLDPVYQERLAAAIDRVVRDAAAAARPASLRVGARRMGAVSPWFTTERFGGRKPGQGAQIGLIRDSRDPVVVDDTVTGIGLFDPAGGTIAAIVHVNTHMEVAGSTRLLTSDFAHAARELLEARLGGLGIVWVGAVGGLQTPLGVDLPATTPDGRVVWQTCDESAVADPDDAACFGAAVGDVRPDGFGDPIPASAGGDRFERVDSYGRLLGALAADLVEAAPDETAPRLEVRHAPLYLPLQNRFLEIAGRVQDPAALDPIQALVEQTYPEYLDYVLELRAAFGSAVLDFPEAWIETDPARCPLAGTPRTPGCLPDQVWAVAIGSLHLVTAPGELFPELAFGVPADMGAERDDPTARGEGSRYFQQHDRDCDEVDWARCRAAVEVGPCDCRRYHAVPYDLAPDGPGTALVDHLDGEHRIVLGLAGEMGGYIMPEPDALLVVSRSFDELLSLGIYDLVTYADDVGDHYEESVSLGPSMATEIQRVVQALFAGTDG